MKTTLKYIHGIVAVLDLPEQDFLEYDGRWWKLNYRHSKFGPGENEWFQEQVFVPMTEEDKETAFDELLGLVTTGEYPFNDGDDMNDNYQQMPPY